MIIIQQLTGESIVTISCWYCHFLRGGKISTRYNHTLHVKVMATSDCSGHVCPCGFSFCGEFRSFMPQLCFAECNPSARITPALNKCSAEFMRSSRSCVFQESRPPQKNPF